MAATYPPEAPDRFVHNAIWHDQNKVAHTKNIEGMADGYRMSFKTAGGHVFKVAIDMPKAAKPGSYMFNYYVSAYPNTPGAGSIVETGISFSQSRGWMVAVNAAGHNLGHPYAGDPLGKRLDLTIVFKDPAKGARTGRIDVILGGQSVGFAWADPRQIDHIRLVSASGDVEGSDWDSMGMSLVEVDGKAPSRLVGHPEWMHGAAISAGNRRVVWEGASAHGFRCRLPPESKPATGAPRA